MREIKKTFFTLCLVLFCAAVQASDANIIKVLPHFIDLRGRHTVGPTLVDRDAYQAYLRSHPTQRSAIRFDIQWKAPKAQSDLKMKVEMRGTGGKAVQNKTLEKLISPKGSRQWDALQFDGDAYKKFGDVIAWRVTLWENDKQVAEKKSFLW